MHGRTAPARRRAVLSPNEVTRSKVDLTPTQRSRERARMTHHQNHDLEVRTKSYATAGAIVAAGYEPIRILMRDGFPMFCFSPAAEPALVAYLKAKTRLERMVEELAK